MDSCRPNRSNGDALHAVLCVPGFESCWQLRVIKPLGRAGFFMVPLGLALYTVNRVNRSVSPLQDLPPY